MGQRKCSGLWMAAMCLAAIANSLPLDSPADIKTLTLAGKKNSKSADGASSSLPVEGLEFPNTALIPGDLTEQLGVDKFFSLWFVFLDVDVFTSDKNFTILAPVNVSPLQPRPTMEDKDRVRQLVLNHIVLGKAISSDDLQRPLTLTTLGGQQLHFKALKDGSVVVNGVRVLKNDVQVPHGIILVLEDYLFMDLYHGDIEGSHSTHFAANPPIPMVTSSTSGDGGFPMIELGTHDLHDHSEIHHPTHHAAMISHEKVGAALLANRQHQELLESQMNGTVSFYKALVQVLSLLRSGTSDFLRYLERSGLAQQFSEDDEYTAFIPMDDAFAQWYPIDWGFNPFDVDSFVSETILNHFVRGQVRQANFKDGQTLTTLGGKQLKVSTKPKLSINGVEIFDGDTPISHGNVQFVGDLFFVDSAVVSELNKNHRDVESAPLVAHPWYSSQFLSHIYRELSVRNQFHFVLDYLNRSHHELRDDLPSHDGDHRMMRYTFFVPKDDAFFNVIPQDAPDPFIADDEFRHKILLSHFVRQRLYDRDLVDGLNFTMANNQTAQITVKDGEKYINGAQILESDIFIYNLGTVFVVDRVLFVNQDMINAVYDKLPSSLFLFGGPPDTTQQVENQGEDTTVVVDLLEELSGALETTAVPTDSVQTDTTDIVFPSTASL